jgi:hypothetical protein
VHTGINELEGDEEYDVEGHPFFAGNNNNTPPPPTPALGNEERMRADEEGVLIDVKRVQCMRTTEYTMVQ